MEYIERKLAKYIFKTENLEITGSNVDDREYSRNEILENKINLIVGESGRGKSSFLKNIEKEVENSIYKELVSLDYENNFRFEDKKIYLLDSIDEDRNQESEKTYNKKLRKIIDEIKALNSENRIILTCREGYIPNEIVKKYEIDVYKLLPITQEQINLVLEEEKEQFWNFIKKSNLEEHLGNIVILQTLIKNYKNYKTEVTISEIYMDLCKSFLEIETGNEVSFIGENHDEIMEELSILLSSKYFLKEKFPNESLELNNKKLGKKKKEKLSKVPIFIGDKKEYRVYHKSIEEFLIAFYFHKKIEYKELDLKSIVDIFFYDGNLKIELRDILNFLIELEDEEFKKIILEIDPAILVKVSNYNLNMQSLILMKNIEFLQKNPYYMWSNWEYFRNNSKIDKDLDLKKVLLQISDVSSIGNEAFYYLMCLLKNSKNRSLEEFIFTILEKRIEKYSSLRDILNGVSIEDNSFNLKLHNLLKKKQIKLQDDFYYMDKFLKSIYKNIEIKDFIFYIKELKKYSLKYLIKGIDEDYLLRVIDDMLDNYKDNQRDTNEDNQIIFLINSLNEKNIVNKNEVLNILEKAIEKKIFYLNKIKIANLILSLNDKKKYLRKIFEGDNEYIVFFKKEDIEENLEFLLNNYPLEKYKNVYREIRYKFEIQKIDLLLKKEKREIQTKGLDEEIQENLIELKINFQEEKLIQLIRDIGLDEAYKKIKEDKDINENITNLVIKYLEIGISFKKNSEGFKVLDYLIFKYLNNNIELKMNDLIEKNKESIYNLLLYFNHEEFSDSLIKFLLQEEFFKEKILKDLDNLNNTILFSRNKEKIFEYLKVSEVEALRKVLEKEYLNYEWSDSQEEIILDKLSLKNNKSILNKKIINSNGKLNATFLKYYLDEYDINYLFQLFNFEYLKDSFENIIGSLEAVGNLEVDLEKLTDEIVEKIILCYDTDYEEYQEPKEIVFDVDTNYKLNSFIFIKLFNALRNNKRIELLQKLSRIKFKNRKITNYIAYTKKIILENQLKVNEVIDIIKNSKFEEKYDYFNSEKFIKDLLIVVEHLSELRLQIKLKNYKEDEINDLIRFGLEMKEYYVYDQRRGGESESKKNPGERDFVIKQNKAIVTILEALILNSIDTGNINKHYNKLNDNYDTAGNKINYFLCYYLGENFNLFVEKYVNSSNKLFSSEIQNLSEEYTEKSNIKIMRTKFKEKKIYHLLINFEN